jgi:hypothetical protein
VGSEQKGRRPELRICTGAKSAFIRVNPRQNYSPPQTKRPALMSSFRRISTSPLVDRTLLASGFLVLAAFFLSAVLAVPLVVAFGLIAATILVALFSAERLIILLITTRRLLTAIVLLLSLWSLHLVSFVWHNHSSLGSKAKS